MHAVRRARSKARDQETERRERLRYEVLERVYLYTGEDCEVILKPRQLGEALGLSFNGSDALLDDLVRLGYLRKIGDGPDLCITEAGVEYLRRAAWRRRSVRE